LLLLPLAVPSRRTAVFQPRHRAGGHRKKLRFIVADDVTWFLRIGYRQVVKFLLLRGPSSRRQAVSKAMQRDIDFPDGILRD
jgi:hypothetical protein